MRRPIATAALIAAVLAAAPALADDAKKDEKKAPPVQWLANLEEAQPLAARTGRVILLVTAWKKEQNNTSDSWRERVQADEAVQKALAAYIPVLWEFDGREGRVMKWTFAHGNEDPEPTVLAWLLDAAGEPILSAEGKQFDPAQFAAWLGEHAALSYPTIDPGEFEALRKEAKALAVRKSLGKTLADVREMAGGGGKASEAEQAEAKRLLALIDPWIEHRQKQAAAARENGDPIGAMDQYAALAADLKGDVAGDEAAKLVKELKRDKKFKEEVKAQQMFEKLVAAADGMKSCDGTRHAVQVGRCAQCRDKNAGILQSVAPALKKFVEKYPESGAAKRAQAMLDDWGLGG